MTIFVLAKAYTGADEYIDITDTQVFATFKEAQEYMLSEVEEYLADEEDDWAYDWGDEPDPVSVHLSCHNYEDEVIWAISEHEI